MKRLVWSIKSSDIYLDRPRADRIKHALSFFLGREGSLLSLIREYCDLGQPGYFSLEFVNQEELEFSTLEAA